MNIEELKNVLEMKLENEKRKTSEMVEKAIAKHIGTSIEIEGIKIIECDYPKDVIETRLNGLRDRLRRTVINALKHKLSPDSYMNINEYLNGITEDSIKSLQELYDSRHRMDDMRDMLEEIFGGDDDED